MSRNRLAGLVPSLVVTILSSTAVLAQCNQDCVERRTITVNASAAATADADLAIVRVGYKIYGPDAQSAYATASDISNAIMQALIASGIPRSAIESSSQVLQHTQPYDLQEMPIQSEERHRRQFTVAQAWTIRIRPDAAGAALNTAIHAGANESGWIEWALDNPTALQAQASAKALANARKIAAEMVQKSDVHLGHLVSVTDNPPYSETMSGAVTITAGPAAVMGQNGTLPLAVNSRRVASRVSILAVFAIE